VRLPAERGGHLGDGSRQQPGVVARQVEPPLGQPPVENGGDGAGREARVDRKRLHVGWEAGLS